MNLDQWADQVCRIRDLLQESGIAQGSTKKVLQISLTRDLRFLAGNEDKWTWVAKCDAMECSGITASDAVTGLLKKARERLKDAIERMHRLQTLEVSAETLLAEDDGDLT